MVLFSSIAVLKIFKKKGSYTQTNIKLVSIQTNYANKSFRVCNKETSKSI